MRFSNWYYTLFTIAILFTSCSKDTATTSEEEQVRDDEQIAGTDFIARNAAKTLYDEYYLVSRTESSDSAWSGDETSCDAGDVPQNMKNKIFTRIEYFRKAVGLNNTVSENDTKSEKAQEAALMMDANNALDHFPPSTWKCYSEAGKEGAGNSLLTTAKNAEAIDSYMRDAGSANGPVGHRRWLLYPELQEIGVGNTDGANAIWVLNGGGASLENTPEYITWPAEGYTPKFFIYPRWSFSLKNADFTDAKVSMQDAMGNTISLVTEELNDQFGDSTLVWVPEGIQTNTTEDISYSVSITDVVVNGEAKDYSYEVIVFDPTK